MNICVILNLIFMKTFDKIFQNTLVGIMEHNGIDGWVGEFRKSWTTAPKMCGLI